MTAPARRAGVVVLISGRGSNLRALAEQARLPDAPYAITQVLSDQPAAAGLGVAGEFGIAAGAIDPRDSADRSAWERRLGAALDAQSPSLVVLAGFMRILSAELVARFAGRILNIHPSLLPAWPGVHTHRRVLASGAREHGATVHYVSAELDAGPPVLQGRVPVLAGDDEARLAARVQTVEHRLYPLAVRWHCSGRLRCADGAAWLDGRRLGAPLQLEALEPA